VAKEFGVEINLSKSILSTNGSFEFAKRTVIKGNDVSGICWKQFLSYGSLATVTNTLLSLLEKGSKAWNNIGLVRALCSKVGVAYLQSASSRRMADRRLKQVLISMLGSYAKAGLIPLSWLACSLMDPEEKDLRKLDFNPPVNASHKYLTQVSHHSKEGAKLFNGNGLEINIMDSNLTDDSPLPGIKFPFSKESFRQLK